MIQHEQIEPREGVVMVYDWNGRYLGCMGIERWHRLLRDDMGVYDRTDRRASLFKPDSGPETNDRPEGRPS